MKVYEWRLDHAIRQRTVILFYCSSNLIKSLSKLTICITLQLDEDILEKFALFIDLKVRTLS